MPHTFKKLIFTCKKQPSSWENHIMMLARISSSSDIIASWHLLLWWTAVPYIPESFLPETQQLSLHVRHIYDCLHYSSSRFHDDQPWTQWRRRCVTEQTCLEKTAMSSLKESEEQTSAPAVPLSRGVQVASSHFSNISASNGNKGCLKKNEKSRREKEKKVEGCKDGKEEKEQGGKKINQL